MTSRNSKRGSSALDSLMAGFAAGAAAFIIYAMPQGHFEHAVALSGLPMILAAAQAPLGMTARSAVMIAAGIGSFVLVWLVLRALSKPAPQKEIKSGPVEIEMEPPRLRRADMHPDAPSRRPILAGVDLGPSFDALSASSSEKMNGGASEEIKVSPAGELLDGVENHEGQADEDLPEFAGQADYEPLDASQEAPQRKEVPLDDKAGPALLAASEFHKAALDKMPNEVHPEETFDECSLNLSPRHIETGELAAHRLPKAEKGEKISELMQRLEAGLGSRRRGRWAAPAGQPTNGVATAPGIDHLDARLRGAIDELQKLASRGN